MWPKQDYLSVRTLYIRILFRLSSSHETGSRNRLEFSSQGCISSVHSLSRVGLFAIPWTTAHRLISAPTPRLLPNSWLHSQSFLHNLCKQGDIFSLPSSYISQFFPSSFLLFFLFHSFLCLLHLFICSSFLHRSLGWFVVCL